MKTRITTAIIFSIVMIAFVLPAIKLPWLTAIFFGIICLLCTLEYVQAMKRVQTQLPVSVSLMSVLLMFVPVIVWSGYKDLRPGWQLLTKNDLPIQEFWDADMIWLTFLSLGLFALTALIYTFACLIIQSFKHGPAGVVPAFIGLTTIPYIVFPFTCSILFLFAVPNGFRWLVLSLLAPWVTDIAAYYAGTYFGSRKLIQSISPNKTVEGFIGGAIGSVMFCFLYFILFMRGADPLRSAALSVSLYGLLTGLVLGVCTQCGDWLASAVKRLAGRKDFSRLLPGHGGVLDRFDSVIFSLPITLVAALFYTLLR